MVGIGLKIRLEEERKGNKIFKIMFRSTVMLKISSAGNISWFKSNKKTSKNLKKLRHGFGR